MKKILLVVILLVLVVSVMACSSAKNNKESDITFADYSINKELLTFSGIDSPSKIYQINSLVGNTEIQKVIVTLNDDYDIVNVEIVKLEVVSK